MSKNSGQQKKEISAMDGPAELEDETPKDLPSANHSPTKSNSRPSGERSDPTTSFSSCQEFNPDEEGETDKMDVDESSPLSKENHVHAEDIVVAVKDKPERGSRKSQSPKSERKSERKSIRYLIGLRRFSNVDKNQNRQNGDLSLAPHISTSTTQSEAMPQKKRGSFWSGGDSSGNSGRWRKKSSRDSQNATPVRHGSRRISVVTYMTRSVRAKTTKSPKDPTKLIKSTNPNKPLDYVWMSEVMRAIDADNEVAGSYPLFCVAGACPSAFANMQSVMFAYTKAKKVDYWWIKPEKDNAEALEKATLTYNTAGAWKNDPGKSKSVYDPVMDLFNKGVKHGDLSFVIHQDGKRPRSCICVNDAKGAVKEQLYIFLIWQEDWTINPFARSKFLKGKVVFKHHPGEPFFYAREYLLKDGIFKFTGEDTDEFTDMFRGEGANEVKDLYVT